MSLPPQLRKISDTVWELPVTFKDGMRVPARIIAPEALIGGMEAGVFDQAANVACLPGIVNYSWCMPDGHWGYGFPIGGVAAMDPDTGVISPGGIGFDINCGMRLVLTNLTEEEVRPRLHELVDQLFCAHPDRRRLHRFRPLLAQHEFRQVIEKGSRWCLENGYALAGGSGDDRGGRLLRGRRCRHVQRQGHRTRLRPDRHPRLRQPLLRDPGGTAGEHLRRKRPPGPSASPSPTRW